MVGQIVEISQNDYYIKKHRGLLEIYQKQERIAQLPFDDIISVILSAQDATLSKNIMTELALRNIPVVICGRNYMPAALMLPAGFSVGSLCHPLTQARQGASLNHYLWQQIIKAKIYNQYHLAKLYDPEHPHILRLQWLYQNVKSGDKTHHEGEAAKLYFPIIFGDSFKRDPILEGKNSQLNYGYAILRSAVARALCAAGLSCALGIHHRNLRNAFCLADDVMEPFRPLVDQIVLTLDDDPILNSHHKTALSALIHVPISTPKGKRPLYLALHELAIQLARIYNEKSREFMIYDWW